MHNFFFQCMYYCSILCNNLILEYFPMVYSIIDIDSCCTGNETELCKVALLLLYISFVESQHPMLTGPPQSLDTEVILLDNPFIAVEYPI